MGLLKKLLTLSLLALSMKASAIVPTRAYMTVDPGNPSGGDDSAALQVAIDRGCSSGLPVALHSGVTYKVGATLRADCIGGSFFSYGVNGTTILEKLASLNGSAIVISSTDYKVHDLYILGDGGNGGDGLVCQANHCIVDNVTIDAMGRDNFRIGCDSSGCNANSSEYSSARSFNAGRYGRYIHDNPGGAPNANAGACVGCFSIASSSDNLRIGNSWYQVEIGYLGESAGNGSLTLGANVYLTADSEKSTFFGGDVNEGNGLSNVYIETGAVANQFYGTALGDFNTSSQSYPNFIDFGNGTSVYSDEQHKFGMYNRAGAPPVLTLFNTGNQNPGYGAAIDLGVTGTGAGGSTPGKYRRAMRLLWANEGGSGAGAYFEVQGETSTAGSVVPIARFTADAGGVLVDTITARSFNLDFVAGGAQQVLVSTHGAVGLGVSNPQYQLDLVDSNGIHLKSPGDNTFPAMSTAPRSNGGEIHADAGADLDRGTLILSAGGGSDITRKMSLALKGYGTTDDRQARFISGSPGVTIMQIAGFSSNLGRVGVMSTTDDCSTCTLRVGGNASISGDIRSDSGVLYGGSLSVATGGGVINWPSATAANIPLLVENTQSMSGPETGACLYNPNATQSNDRSWCLKTNHSSNGLLEFLVSGTNTGTPWTGSTMMALDRSGNLGIGTTAPGGKLDVNGTVAIRGAATVTSSFTVVATGNSPAAVFTPNLSSSTVVASGLSGTFTTTVLGPAIAGSTVTLNLPVGVSMVSVYFHCTASVNSLAAVIKAGLIVNGQFVDGETASVGLVAPQEAVSTDGTNISFPELLTGLSSGSNNIALTLATSAGTGTIDSTNSICKLQAHMLP